MADEKKPPVHPKYAEPVKDKPVDGKAFAAPDYKFEPINPEKPGGAKTSGTR